jgi:serine/threonine protein kinase
VEPLLAGDPTRIGRFVLQGRLGSGGMGHVYLGVAPSGEQAAVKVIRSELAHEPEFRRRFRREAAAAAAVSGMFTARVLDADPDAEPPWLATQFVGGPSLRAAVLAGGPLSQPDQRRLALELAEALSAIHAAGLVHRDLKPANVLLSAGGAKVIDFGISHAHDSTRLTSTGLILGTPDYMAPEQVTDPAGSGPAADVFAMGATLAFAATGRSPFATEQAASTLYRVVNLEPDLVGVPPETASIARACLAKDPARRPLPAALAANLRGTTPTAAMGAGPPRSRPFEAALLAAPAFDTVPPAPTPTPTPPPPRSAGRNRALWIAGAVAAVLIAVTAAVTIITMPRATASGATSTPPTTVGTAAATTSPDTPQVRYVDRLCASGELLTSLGDTATTPKPTTDLATTRRDFLTSVDRAVGVMDVALADFAVLRDDAPTPEIGRQFGAIVDEFSSARTSFVAARDGVEASDPLTIVAYGRGVRKFTDGVRNLSLAAQLIKGVTLPPDYTAASATAPRCND